MDAENFSLAQFSHANAGSEAMLTNPSVMPSAISCQELSVSYGEKEVLSRLSVEIPGFFRKMPEPSAFSEKKGKKRKITFPIFRKAPR